MAADHVSNQRHKSSGRKGAAQSGQGTRSTKKTTPDLGTLSEMREEAGAYLQRGASQIRDMTRDHEGTAVLVALAAGFGIGLLVGATLAPSHRKPRSWSDRLAAEGIGRRFLERVENMLPDAITERLGR